MSKPTLKQLRLPADPRPNFAGDYLKKQAVEDAWKRKQIALDTFRRGK